MQSSKKLFGSKQNGFSMHDQGAQSVLFSKQAAQLPESVLEKAGTVDTVSSTATGKLQEPY
jgi:hypothetical protein